MLLGAGRRTNRGLVQGCRRGVGAVYGRLSIAQNVRFFWYGITIRDAIVMVVFFDLSSHAGRRGMRMGFAFLLMFELIFSNV